MHRCHTHGSQPDAHFYWDGRSWYCREKRAASRARYDAAEKGRLRFYRYNRTEGGRARYDVYNATEAGQVRIRTYRMSEMGRAAQLAQRLRARP